MTTTRESEFELAYRLQHVFEFGHGHGSGYGLGAGHGSDYGYVHEYGSGFGLGSLDSKKDLIDDDDARV